MWIRYKMAVVLLGLHTLSTNRLVRMSEGAGRATPTGIAGKQEEHWLYGMSLFDC